MDAIIGLLILAVCILLWLSVRISIQKKNIASLKEQIEDILEHPQQNANVKLAAPDKQFEELLAVLNQMIEGNVKERIRFYREDRIRKEEIANISHDLRTPLTSILGYLDILSESKLSLEERQEYLNVVIRKSKLMKNLVNDFYELSMMECNDYVLHKEQIYPYVFLCEVLLAFYADFEAKGIDVRTHLQENVEAVFLDSSALTRILSNLVQNALRYTQSYLEIWLRQEGKQITFIFENDTRLLTKKDMEFIFERTYTADESRSNGQTGLGLSITKKLVELQGGRIFASMQDSIFTIQIIFPIQE